jgi:hypothetical protein
MQKVTVKNLFVLIALTIIVASCTKKYVTQPYTPPPPPGYQYSLTTDVQPIFDSKCIRCHKTGGVNPDLTTGKSYNAMFSLSLIDTLAPANSEIYTEMYNGSMSSYCTQQDADVVLQWITQGAKNN